MADTSTPELKVLITPQFGDNEQATTLLICLTIDCPALCKGSTIATFPATSVDVRAVHDIQASDDKGSLPVVFQNPKESEQCLERSWVTLRDTFGNVEIRYEVSISSKDQSKAKGPVLGLHSEQGGLLGSGFAIVAVTPSKGVYRNIVEWDLTRAPSGIRAVWTYGEGPRPVERVGSSFILRDSVYMVGHIQSNLPAAAIDSNVSGDYGFYWFGSLPPNIEVIKDIHQAFFTKVQKFFESDEKNAEDFKHPFFANVPKDIKKCLVEPAPHRSFVRNTGSTKSFGGTSFAHSHILNYDDQIFKAHDYDLVRRMAYEMAHIWLGPSTVDGLDWLYEGIKECLSIYMPFRNKGPRTGDYFQATISMLCTRYYTSPLINLPFEDVLKLADTNAYAREHISARAWAFVVGVDLRARRIAKGELQTIRPIEEIAMIPLANNKALGKAHGVEQWMEFLTLLMGDELQRRYEEFRNGTTILLLETLYGAKSHYLKQVDDLILDFGMDRESFAEGLVRGLKVGSRAEIAGLRNGDQILWSSHEWRCVDNSKATMELEIETKEGLRRVRYLPRSFDATKSWAMCKRDE